MTLTNDLGKILHALHEAKIEGKASFTTGIQIAQLALKHRQNKNQRQRVIVFVGSPVETDEKSLVKLAKKMKKNNVAVDIINFGQDQENTSKLEAFIENVNSGDNSHLVTIPPGPHLLSDLLLSSPILQGDDGGAGYSGGAGAGGGNSFEFGVDPNLDPELALALRMSLEEEKARLEAEQAADKKPGESSDAPATTSAPAPSGDVPMDEEAMLAQALAMSMGEGEQEGDVDMDALTEDEQIARAIEMSMGDNQPTEAQSSAIQGSAIDPNLMSNILSNLPGVDTDDPRIQSALGLSKKEDEKDKEEK